jgi:hypothetical protein
MIQLVLQVPFEVIISPEGHMVLFIQDVLLLHVGILDEEGHQSDNEDNDQDDEETWLKMMRK